MPRFLFAVFSALILAPRAPAQPDGPQDWVPPSIPAGAQQEELQRRVRILAVGDVIAHDTVLEAAKASAASRSSAETYDFDPMFAGVAGIISGASLAICNFESTMTGDGSYSGYPNFDSPPALASALARAGFDAATTTNNHMFDQGMIGFDATPPLLYKAGIVAAGTRAAGGPRYALADSDGVKVAVIAYTYAGGSDAEPTFNSFRPARDVLPRINYFIPGSVSRPAAEFAAAAREARAAGARIVVAFVHWGEEYERVPRERERAFASALAEAGADVIFGSHPHVVQRMEFLGTKDGRSVPVFYSLGNFLSNQRRDTVDNPLTEDGLIAMADFDVPADGGRPVLASVRALPTWVKKTEPPSLSFAIVPLGAGFRSLPALAGPGLGETAATSLSQTARVLGIDGASISAAVSPFPVPLPALRAGGFSALDPEGLGFLLSPPAASGDRTLDVPYFGQTLEWPWGGDFMGDTRALIADNGCVMVSSCMVLAYYGIDLDPRRLDRALIEGGGYLPLSYQGEALGRMGFNFSAIPRIFPPIASVEFGGRVTSDAGLDFVRRAIAAGRPAVLLLTSPRGFSHAVAAVGTAGRDILINDPLDPAVKSLLSGYGRARTDGGWPLQGVISETAVYVPAKASPN